LTIEGAGTLEQYELILQEVVYDNALGDADTTDRIIEVKVEDDGSYNFLSDAATSVVTVVVGCPCSSFTTDAATAPGIFEFFDRTDGVSDTRTEFGWANASCSEFIYSLNDPDEVTIAFMISTEAPVSLFREMTFHSEVLDVVDFGIDQGHCFVRASGSDFDSGNPYIQSKTTNLAGHFHSAQRPPALLSYTQEMHQACVHRISIQIERLRATFDAGGAQSCGPLH